MGRGIIAKLEERGNILADTQRIRKESRETGWGTV